MTRLGVWIDFEKVDFSRFWTDFGPPRSPQTGPDPARIRPGTPAALALTPEALTPATPALTPEARDAKKWAKHTMLKAET